MRYSLQYNVAFDSVSVESEPTDCDFSRSPLGSKACHYEKEITVMPLGTESGTGRRVISYDNGKTGTHPDKDNPAIVVTWKKVEEP